jgi:hypothetical protein
MTNQYVWARFFGFSQQILKVTNESLPRTQLYVRARSNATKGPESRIALSEIWSVVTADARDLAYLRHDLLPEARVAAQSCVENDSWRAAASAHHVERVAAYVDARIQVWSSLFLRL